MTTSTDVLDHPTAIAIIGMAGRFPGAQNLHEFRQNLEKGVESITFLSESELLAAGAQPDQVKQPNYVNAAPLLEGFDQFDASFFEYSAREAEIMDPQHRLFLECAWHALEDAGYASPAGNRSIGVFAGAGGVMYSYLLSDLHINQRLIGFSGSREHIGNDKDYLSTRISYKLNLRGPSLSIQTACSTSLVSVHLASQSLLNGECDMALAGGISVRTPQRVGYLFQEGEIFSPDGHCRPFDAQGQGTIFGSGAGIVVLKRLEDAMRDGDTVEAVIRGSAIGNDGAQKVSYWATVAEGQADAMDQALAVAQVEPETIGFVEAHGTATTLGDPVEIFALKQAFATDQRQFCAIGSVKSNIGHTDAASGVAGLIKAVLSLKHKTLYPTLHFSTPNPLINFENSPFYVNTETKEWAAQAYPRRAAVNSLGIGGTNAHVILEEAPVIPVPDSPVDASHQLLTLSAKTPEALAALAKRYAAHLTAQPAQSFADLCYTANTRQAHFPQRLALVAASPAEAITQLASFGQSASPLPDSPFGKSQMSPVAFLFTGQGAQYVEMGRELYETEPIFRQTLDRCDELLRPLLPVSLLEVLYPSQPAHAGLIDQTAYTQPALFALEYALAELWMAWGIQPTIVMGHSVGEVVAACVAGVFSLEDGLKLIAARGRLMQALPATGTMVAVWASAAQVQAAIAPYAETVSIASINGPTSVVISGERQAIGAIVGSLEAQGVRTKELVVSHAFHSPLMEPMLADFAKVAQAVYFTPPTRTLIANLTGEIATDASATPDYWVQHVRQPVAFAQGMKTLHDAGMEIFLEIGPKPDLLGMGRRCLPDGYGLWLPSLRPQQPAQKQILDSLGALYQQGAQIDWPVLYRHVAHSRQRVKLPAYPFQRQRYWITPTAHGQSSQPGLAQATDDKHPLLGKEIYSPLIQATCFASQIALARTPFLMDHRVLDTIVVPATGYVEMALAAAQRFLESDAVTLADLVYQAPFTFNNAASKATQLIIYAPTADRSAPFEIVSLADDRATKAKERVWQNHASGVIRPNLGQSLFAPTAIEDLRTRCTEEIGAESLYGYFHDRGYQFGPAHQSIRTLWLGHNETLAELVLPAQLDAEFTGYVFHPALLDACSQALLPILPQIPTEQIFITMGKDRVDLYARPTPRLWVHARRQTDQPANAAAFKGDVDIYNEHGQPVAAIRGYTMTLTTRQALAKGLRSDDPNDFQNQLYEIEWRESAPTRPFIPSSLARGLWLVFADTLGVADQFCRGLTDLQAATIKVLPGQRFEQIGPQTYTIDPLRPADFALLLEAVNKAKYDLRVNFQGVMHFWSFDESESQESLSQQQATGVGALLHLVQALSQLTLHARFQLFLMTQNAQSVVEGERVGHPAQAALWALGRVLDTEQPHLHVRCVDLASAPATQTQTQPLLELFRHLFTEPEPFMAIRQAKRFVPRLVTASLTPSLTPSQQSKTPGILTIQQPGNIDSLIWLPALHPQPAADEVEIKTQALGLNFRDVLIALGVYPGGGEEFGLECAGEIVRLGSRVTRFQVGDRVMALADRAGTFKEYVALHQDMVTPIPSTLSMSEAATVPTVFLTAYVGLIQLAQLSAGERVLIHSAAGGVGLAAVQLAQQVGAEVYATASPGKWDHLRSLGVRQVMNSRSLDYAEEIMWVTQGRGVDVVLGALTDETIPVNMGILAANGRCIDIGSNSAEKPLQTHTYADGKRYHSFDLRHEARRDSAQMQQILQTLGRQFESGALQPLPLTPYARTALKDAFRDMQQAKQIGKICISLESVAAPEAANRATVLVTGGLGGVGITVGEWLAVEKGMALALVGRSQPNAEAQQKIAALRARGVEVQSFQADVTDRQAVADLLAAIQAHMPPLRGLVHAAGLLDDGLLNTMSWPQFRKALAPKMDGAWNLHLLTQETPLDFFLLLSSVTALLGTAGVGNYAAGNGFLDGLAHYRRSRGLPGLSINWGPWAEVGLLAKMSESARRQWTEGAISPLSSAQSLQILQSLLAQTKAQYGAFKADWPLWLAHQPGKTIPPLLLDVAAKAKPRASQPASASRPEQTKQESAILQSLRAAPANQRQKLLTTFVSEQLAAILGATASAINPRQGFLQLGLDSLLSIELRNRLQTNLACTLPPTLVFNYPTVETLTHYLLDDVLKLPAAAPAEASPTPQPTNNGAGADKPPHHAPISPDDDLAALLAEINEVSDSEIEGMFR